MATALLAVNGRWDCSCCGGVMAVMHRCCGCCSAADLGETRRGWPQKYCLRAELSWLVVTFTCCEPGD